MCPSQVVKKYKLQTYLLYLIKQKAQLGLGILWSQVVAETREPANKKQPWIGGHFPAICQHQKLNLGGLGDKGDTLLCYPGPCI